MGFRDVLKNSFLEQFEMSDMSLWTIGTALLVTALLGIYIFIVYRVVTRKTFISQSFNISLVALALITAAVILAVQSSVVISLGMVGALSIVRFRTAIKDPMDLVFLFWSISVGIICGAGLFEVAVLVSIIVTLVVILLQLVPMSRAPMLLVVSANTWDIEKTLDEIIRKYTSSYTIKSRNLTQNGADLIVEMRVKDGAGLVSEIAGLEDIYSVSLLSHDGEDVVQ